MSFLFGNSPFISFEIFPPKTFAGTQKLYKTLDDLRSVNPAYISVTYGAGGSTQKNSFEVCRVLHNELNLPTMAHYTCVGQGKEDIVAGLRALLRLGISRYMLLRGDKPKATTSTSSPSPKTNELHHANDLVRLMRGLAPKAIVGVAGYPEKHTEAPSMEADLRHLRGKVTAGADFIVTQMFFENNTYFDFRSKAKAIGIDKPIIPGIMPIANAKQMLKIASLCNATIPESLLHQLERANNDPNKVRQIGTEFAVRQSRNLLKANVPGLHFYTLNNADQVLEIIAQLKPDLEAS